MALSEQSHQEPVRRAHALRRVESVDPSASVRHVDQLEPAELELLLGLADSDASIPADESPLEAGEVIVFTDYYRVERV
ncbi:hypothetical protein [Halopiger goleimassiliensis]|uniref:hypothetical protein n=1 Tax=Halopiger goleimassiliensis TaxID=1293048 RepID=UPI000B235DC3|nr:hypothetical protein [Halopiger goleimassiliensis]